MSDKEKKPDNPEQSKRFVDKAREVEADETQEVADRAFKEVAKKPNIPPRGSSS